MRDAYYQPVRPEEVERLAREKGVEVGKMAEALEASRRKKLERMRADPYRHGFVPPVWLAVKGVLRGEPVTQQDMEIVKKGTGLEWLEWREKLLRALGLRNQVKELVGVGANRAGKTDYAARTAVEIAVRKKTDQTIGFQTIPTGRDVQMKRIWHYMPNELKAQNIANKRAKSIHEHISYTDANGFANSKITLANGSAVRFVSYKEDVNAAMEGMEKHRIWLDEEEPLAFVTAARGRVASVNGSVLLTFTPVKGYTPVVDDYMATMQVIRWRTAYMLPRDGGEPCPWLELGLTREEYEKLDRYHAEENGEDPGVPEARPENCLKWILGGEGGEQDESVRDRVFDRMPRFAICKGGEAAIIWFYGSDNPYGMPMEVIKNACKNKNAKAEIKKRVYGVAEKMRGSMFPKFDEKRHVVGDDEIPKKLVRALVIDPAPDRNWFWGHIGYSVEEECYYVLDEWPSGDEIPGVGVPGEWAIVSDRNEGVNDGAKGDAQDSFGLGFDHYKFEIARREGWKDYLDWARTKADPLAEFPEDIEGTVEEWSEMNGVRMKVVKRVIDSRAASSRKTTAGENITLFEEVGRRLEGLEPASGQQIAIGVEIINDLLARNKMKVHRRCVNTRFALKHWSGKDGNKGACKDPIDMLRYGVTCGLDEYEAADETEIGEEGESAENCRRTEGKRRKRAGGL